MAYSFDNITFVKPEYLSDCIVNFACTITGIPLNIFVLYISTRPDVVNGAAKVRYSIIGMTACNLYGAAGLSALYSWYLVTLSNNIPMTVLMCSLIRRLLGATLNAPHLALLVVAIDRFALIVYNVNLSGFIVSVLFGSILIYVHGVLNMLQFAFGRIAIEDICGPTIAMPFIASVIVLPIVPLAIVCALILNLSMLSHLYRCRKRVQSSAARKFEVVYWQRCIYGLLAQILIPCLFVLPQAIAEAFFFINPKIEFPRSFWLPINGSTCLYFSLNPIVTLISVKQFRAAAKRFLGKTIATRILPQKVLSYWNIAVAADRNTTQLFRIEPINDQCSRI